MYGLNEMRARLAEIESRIHSNIENPNYFLTGEAERDEREARRLRAIIRKRERECRALGWIK